MAKKKDDDKKSKDSWHRDNIESTLETRHEHHRNLLNIIQAMDSQLIYEVTKILKEHSGEDIADWSLLDSESKKYNQEVADKVMKKIDDVYSLDSQLHPLAGIIKKANLEKNYFNDRLVKGLYFGHVEQLKRSIGSKNYLAHMQAHHKKNLETVTQSSMEHFVSDVNHKKHGAGVVDYLQSEYQFDISKINTDLMQHDAQNLMMSHITGKLDKDVIHRSYKAPKKPEN